MGHMEPETVIAVIAATSFFWHVAMYAGVLINRMKRLEDRTDDHEKRLDSHDALLERRSTSRN